MNGKTQFDVALLSANHVIKLIFFFGLVMTASQSILRILQRPRSFLAVELISLFSNFLFLFIFVVWMRLGLVGVFWSGAVGSCIGMFAGLFSVKEKLKAKISLALLTPIVIYAVPALLGMFINWTQSQVGRLFINYYTNLEEQGLYSIAFAIGSVLLIFTTAFRLAYDPYALSIMKRPDAKQTYAKFYAFYSFFFCTIFAITACFAKPILIILTPIEYHSAHKIVLWIAGAAFFIGANNIMGYMDCAQDRFHFICAAYISGSYHGQLFFSSKIPSTWGCYSIFHWNHGPVYIVLHFCPEIIFDSLQILVS